MHFHVDSIKASFNDLKWVINLMKYLLILKYLSQLAGNKFCCHLCYYSAPINVYLVIVWLSNIEIYLVKKVANHGKSGVVPMVWVDHWFGIFSLMYSIKFVGNYKLFTKITSLSEVSLLNEIVVMIVILFKNKKFS